MFPLYQLVFIAGCLFIIWKFLIKKKPKLTSPKSVPGPDPCSEEDGNLEEIRSAGSLHEFLEQLHRKWGPIASFCIGKQPIVSIASADLFKQHQKLFDRPVVLFDSLIDLTGENSIQIQNGEEGKRLHQALSRPFAFSECKNYYGSFNDISKQLLDKLEGLPSSTHVPIWENMTIVALKGLLKTAFGYQLPDDKTALDINANYEKAWNKFESYFKKSDPKDFNEEEIKKAIQWYRKFASDVVEARQPTADDNLFVDVLLNGDEKFKVDNAVTFITGGFHTTSCLLTWALYYIAQNEDIQDNVYVEAHHILSDGEVTPENIKDLKYLQQVLDETLRLSMLAPYAARCSDLDTVLDGFKIPASTPVIQALGVVLSDENVWDNPNTFDPNRFSPEMVKDRPSFAFSPFGFAGKRICPGYRFAYVEATIILSTILRRLKFSLVDGQDISRVFGLVTKPSSEIWMTVKPRKLTYSPSRSQQVE